MKLYIKEFSSFLDDGKDIKKELKQKYKLDTRRQDKFIHLSVYGAQLLKEKIEINSDDELYITSGIGDVDIVQKTNTYMYSIATLFKQPFLRYLFSNKKNVSLV